MQVHTIREFKERATPLAFALTTFPGVSEDKVLELLLNYRLETIDQLLELKPKVFYGMKLTPKILDAMERIRLRYEPEREAYRTIDLSKLPASNFFKKVVKITLDFRGSNAHKSWRKQDATRPIVTSLITYVDSTTCFCQAHGTISASQTPSLGPMGRGSSSLSSPQRQGSTGGTSHYIDASAAAGAYPENSWCRCPRKWELAVNYELSTPSGSRCSEQNCLGKLAAMGLATCNLREIFVHGDMHNNEDPNPLFPCGVCENMLRRITHDVQKEYGGDVTLYMFDQVREPKKLVCIPVQEISHREGSNFKRFIQEDLRSGEDDKFLNSSIS
ncbi:CDD/CDA-like deaminase, putative [Bodo saltans]|uniref:CDD/CDA-like deaminase, putative n=1 Tax=Bodo saltans TaxID=75058 RepID=A0A0S4IPY9_BODSA|nr:CDD/CDA-like deaminase, putative [Bodo saltans]|eukprot:CUE70571.1 CDD/CDA-like deaminase, putative [Bodo saltans]